MRRLTVLVTAILTVPALALAGCSSDDSDESDDTTTTTAEAAESTTTAPDVEAALSAFCEAAEGYIAALDDYTGLFAGDSGSLTVGQVVAGTDSLQSAREAAEADADNLQASIDAANAAEEERAKEQEASTGTTSTTVVELPVDDELIERVKQAETDFDTAVEGIDESTPVAEAEVQFTSAAFALEVTWAVLLDEAGCVEDDSQALDDIRQFVAGLQTDLTTLGFYSGKVDGIYGPETAAAVIALQKEVGLPETGYPDPATQKAINEKLVAQAAVSTSALQGLLAGLGFYTGPIDGQWSPELEAAIKALQAELDVPQTGVMDPTTWRAYADRKQGLQELLALEESNATSTTTEAPTTAPPTTAPPTTAAPTTAAPTTAAPTTEPPG